MNILKHQKKISYAILSAIFFLSAVSLMLFSNGVKSPKVEAATWADNGIRATSFAGGGGTEKSPYLISTPEQLGLLAYRVNQNIQQGSFNYRDKHYRLEADAPIDLYNYTWTSIGTDIYKFTGTFDGNGKTILGLNSSNGLFGVVEGATIKNLFLFGEVTNTTTSAIVGGLVAQASKTTNISNIYANITMGGSANTYGGIIGKATGDLKLEHSSSTVRANYSSTYKSSSYIGGVIGDASLGRPYLKDLGSYGSISSSTHQYVGGAFGRFSLVNNNIFENISNNAKVSGNSSSSSVGGVFGYISQSYAYPSIKNIINSADVSSGKYLGGIVGQAYITSITNAYNSGNIIGGSTAENAGGIVGYLNSHITINSSYNHGIISSKNAAGGILGSGDGYSFRLFDVKNDGNVTSTSGAAGGIVGYGKIIVGGYSFEIRRAINTGDIKGNERVGGISGYIEHNFNSGYYLVIHTVYNSGNITANGSFVGGIGGVIEGGLNKSTRLGANFYISNLYNFGKVQGENYIGGIVGYLIGNNDRASLSFLYSGYNAGTISGGTNSYSIGALIGTSRYSYIQNSGHLNVSYYSYYAQYITNSEVRIPPLTSLTKTVVLGFKDNFEITSSNDLFYYSYNNNNDIIIRNSPTTTKKISFSNITTKGYIDGMFSSDIWGVNQNIQNGSFYLKSFYW